MIFIGVDVGAAGGIAVIGEDQQVWQAVPMPQTDAELLETIVGTVHYDTKRFAVLEKVHAGPMMASRAAFSFGGSYRACRMALTCAQIPFDEVDAKRWQKLLQCLSGGDKNVTKVRAMQLFPGVKVTHAIADALLLADYARRTWRAGGDDDDGTGPH